MFIEQKKELIKKIVKRQCELLKMPIIKIRWNKKESLYFKSKWGIPSHISIDINYIEDIAYNNGIFNKSLWDLIPEKFSFRNRIRFIIGHELGHYLHCKKFLNHYKKSFSNLKSKVNYQEYRKRKTEKIADKIGIYLTKNYFNKSEA